MPVNPLIIRKTSSMIDQTHMEYFREHMSDEEKIAAQESLKATYRPPIEFYLFFQRRAIKNPLFLQRSLKYKTEAKRQRRIQMTLFLPGSKDAAGVETQELFPLFIMLARLVSSKTTAKSSSAIYKFSRACILTGDDGVSQPQANFLLPRMDRLALDAKSGSLVILFISFAGAQNSQSGIDSSKIHSGNIGGHCLWSKIPLESLYSSWKEYPNMDLGEKATSVSLVEMQPCFLQLMSMSEKFVEIQVPSNPLTSSSPQQVQVTISAQEVGATENPPYRSSFSFSDFPASSVVLPIHRLRKGQVAFNYSYYNNKLQKTEVTGDFTCPLCKVKCASFKGLECHIATHDFFNFEFWVNEKYPAVNVSLNEVTLTETSKCFKKEKKGDPNARLEPYPFSSMKSSRRKQKTPARNPWPRPIKTDDAADSVKSEKSQIPPGGAESSSQTVPPGMGPADLQMMNMWNSFMKKHRVITGGCIACGCEAFSKLHGPFLVRNLDLLWCWKKYIWTLKIYGRLDAQTLNNCMVLFEQLPVEDTEAFILS
ncbi:polycomb group protein EMBRYONIC FLOWER 2-like [Brassica rapa]|uniref:polycomb group protein EMBRYONIC FLOWER 2-like n=1 Tax=Brassica campestris TaxID=3711 RepID=UPI00142E819E|nr:polycomb group protein EMBRYONIC FLOWER 2-like [Brassica rapa]